MKYAIAQSNSMEKFVEYINIRIEEGWQPTGGIAIDTGHGEYPETTYFQAFVKEDVTTPKKRKLPKPRKTRRIK